MVQVLKTVEEFNQAVSQPKYTLVHFSAFVAPFHLFFVFEIFVKTVHGVLLVQKWTNIWTNWQQPLTKTHSNSLPFVHFFCIFNSE